MQYIQLKLVTKPELVPTPSQGNVNTFIDVNDNLYKGKKWDASIIILTQPGVAGPSGSTGLQGSIGTQGIQGVAGSTGLTGPAGLTGSSGSTGLQGVPGTQGLVGSTGPAGAIGNTGTIGLTGNTGTQGIQGLIGNTGVAGPTGAVGSAGSQGLVGNTGPAGVIGNTGAVGAAGTAGATGSQGLTGNTGSIGATGPQGTIGATGLTGPAGSTGLQGATGLTGTTGTTGATGTAGATGSQGIQGVIGNTGSTGTTGATGTAGATGSQGIQGATGTQGVQGVIGNTGATGADGSVNAWGLLGTTGSNITSNFLGTTDANGLAIRTNNTQRVLIDSIGNVGINGPANAAALLQLESTTKGLLIPRMTTTQKNAIATPPIGLMVFDITLNYLTVYSGSAWVNFPISIGSFSGSAGGNGIDISQVWNTTGVCTAYNVNITNTASPAGCYLMNLLVNNSSVFSVSVGGTLSINGNVLCASGFMAVTATGLIAQGTNTLTGVNNNGSVTSVSVAGTAHTTPNVTIFKNNAIETARITATNNILIGSVTDKASAILNMTSTTKGVLFPQMTTQQKNAITSPANGLMIYDTSLNKLCIYSATAWQTVTSA